MPKITKEEIQYIASNFLSFLKILVNRSYREDYSDAKYFFDMLRSHGVVLPDLTPQKMISIHKQMSNLK